MDDEKLGPMPEPETEPAEVRPGGVDAIAQDAPFAGEETEHVGRDLHPDRNPQVEDHVPDEITAPDDKQQEPDPESSETEEPPA